MKYTRIAEDTFQKLQLNAGVLCTDFDVETGEIEEENLIGATDGGVNFTVTPTFRDDAEGIDNAPTNLLEFKKLDDYAVTMSGTFKTLDTKLAKMLIGAGTVSGNKVTANADLKAEDFTTIWWVGDYGDNDGFIAIKLNNALSTGGFQIQSANKDKGSFAFEFTGHRTLAAQTEVPFELYIEDNIKDYTVTISGSAVTLTDSVAKLAANDTFTVTTAPTTIGLSGATVNVKVAKNANNFAVTGTVTLKEQKTAPTFSSLTWSGLSLSVTSGATVTGLTLTGTLAGEGTTKTFTISGGTITGTAKG